MKEELSVLIEAVRRAGAVALRMAEEGFEVRRKQDGSPVTTADLAVNELLHETILRRFPEDGWLSEESPDDKSRLMKQRVWIVDPIDGTKAFVAHTPEFCISAALVRQEEPVVAAVYNPSTDELFSAVRGQGLRVNGRPVREELGTTDGPVVLVNPWELKAGRFQPIAQEFYCRPVLSIAYALAQVAVNRAAATLTFEPEHEWDLAAGVLLIHEAGGLTGYGGAHQLVRFNQLHPFYRGFLALAPRSARSIRERLASFYKAHLPSS